MQHIKKASVLIYTLILVVISLIMALVILNIVGLLSSNAELQEITRKLGNNVLSKGNLSLKYSALVNTNGSGFTDTYGCPTNVTMSGTIHNTTSSSTLMYQSGAITCMGTHIGNPFSIYILTGSISDTYVSYLWDSVNITAWVGDRNFSDSDNTLIDFSASSLPLDNIDDDFNSDDYTVFSTGSIYYPNWYQDDDADARKLIYGYANPWVWFVNMFWNNSETISFIEQNPNNTDLRNQRIGSMTSSGIALIDINKDYTMKVYKLDRSLYDASKEILPLEVYTSGDNLGTVGYLQENAGVLSISTWSTVNDFQFDFVNHDYAMFVRNNSTGSLLYTLNIQDMTTGSGVYINPIDDSDPTVIKVLANDIIIDNQWRFLSEQFEVIGFK